MEIIIVILAAINLFYIINMLINHSVSGDMFDECLITKKLFYIIELISLVIIIISVISISNKTISTTIIKSNQFNEENIKVSFMRLFFCVYKNYMLYLLINFCILNNICIRGQVMGSRRIFFNLLVKLNTNRRGWIFFAP
jgi:NADH:ubiquinone oxidoreductase subunit 6 (subunit J)